MGTVSFDLLVRTNGAEDNLGETAPFEGSIGNSPYNLEGLLDDGDRQVSSIVNKSRNIILRHLGELFLKDAFEAGQNDERLALVVVVDYSEFDLAIALLNNSRLKRLLSAYVQILIKETYLFGKWNSFDFRFLLRGLGGIILLDALGWGRR